jgi:hypothetical protein
MTSGDMSIKSAPPAEVVQTRPPVQTGADSAASAEAQVKVEAAKTSAQDVSKELASPRTRNEAFICINESHYIGMSFL